MLRYDDNTPEVLRRFVPYKYFKTLLDENRLFLNRIDSYLKIGDKQEGLLPLGLFGKDNPFQQYYEDKSQFIYVLCFTLEDNNFEYMFKEYSAESGDFSGSLFIEIDREEFEKALNTDFKVYSGKVKYYDDFNESTHVLEESDMRVFFSKQNGGWEKGRSKYMNYIWEKEFRYIFDIEPHNISTSKSNLEITLDVLWTDDVQTISDPQPIWISLSNISFIKRICLHPDFSKDNEEELRQLLKKHNLDVQIVRDCTP